MYSTALRCASFLEKNIEKKHLCRKDKNYYYVILEHVYMIPEVNSNWFEISNRFEMSFLYMAIYMEISLRQLSKQCWGSIAHVQMISFN